ncbi:hypothetical protein [Nonomuraea dietziae]|uniref:Uncharacterized protein n=1 Tax=Nonomuraea dietziae TaxID=65515 RepID=A0A7W5Y512_9ACTN|nr:hypothetical protein [Nonomuraea dietziae]MBB3724473.1 hypothetical protein [Nonomuraea dietziae]
MTLPQIPLDDPRVLALAKARQQFAHDCTFLPTWDELTDEERKSALPDARNYLESAMNSGLVPGVRGLIRRGWPVGWPRRTRSAAAPGAPGLSSRNKREGRTGRARFCVGRASGHEVGRVPREAAAGGA